MEPQDQVALFIVRFTMCPKLSYAPNATLKAPFRYSQCPFVSPVWLISLTWQATRPPPGIKAIVLVT